MRTLNSKLGIRELRSFIYQFLFVFYHLIPKFRRELKDCVIDEHTLSRSKNKNRTLYINNYSKPAQKYMLLLKNSTGSDSEFTAGLNKVYEILNEYNLYL